MKAQTPSSDYLHAYWIGGVLTTWENSRSNIYIYIYVFDVFEIGDFRKATTATRRSEGNWIIIPGVISVPRFPSLSPLLSAYPIAGEGKGALHRPLSPR